MMCVLVTLTGASQVSAAPTPLTATLDAIRNSRREIIAVLPAVINPEVVHALKAATARGTTLFLITHTRTVRQGGYLLTLSHAPGTVHTYLTAAQIKVPWIMVDGAWVASGPVLDGGSGAVGISRDRPTLARLNIWATGVTRTGAVSRVDLLKRRYDQP